MTTPLLSLPRLYLSTHLARRIKASLPRSTQAFLSVRKGSSFSRVGRLLFEHRRLKTFLGGQLALTALIFNILTPPPSPINAQPSETPLLSSPTILNTPDPTLRYPVDQITITQGYSFFHPALDLDGATGDPIYPIMAGQVIHTESSRFGYGNFIIVDHQNDHQSLYAHLAHILIKIKQPVTPKTIIGTLGASGHASGDHLHLEIYHQNHPINPTTLLPLSQ